MLTEQRKRHILECLARDGRVVAKNLSQELTLSEDTIRRDLRELAADGLLLRVHGGALPASPTTASLAQRRTMSSAEKVLLGKRGAALISTGQTVIIDGGTTNLELANSLPRGLSATVITHSPLIAAALEFHESIDVILIGGQLYRHSMVTVGAAAMEAISRLRADLFFLGLTGIHAVEGLTTGAYEEAAIKRTLIARSAETVVLATREKIGAVSAHMIAPTAAVTTLVATDHPTLDPFESVGITILRN